MSTKEIAYFLATNSPPDNVDLLLRKRGYTRDQDDYLNKGTVFILEENPIQLEFYSREKSRDPASIKDPRYILNFYPSNLNLNGWKRGRNPREYLTGKAIEELRAIQATLISQRYAAHMYQEE